MSRRSELMVVGGFVLGLCLIGYLQSGPASWDLSAGDSLRRGDLQQEEESARECQSQDGGGWSADQRLRCISVLAELEFMNGKVQQARARIDGALEEASRLGRLVSNDTRADLLSGSCLVWFRADPKRALADARQAVALARGRTARATANLRLGETLQSADEAELPLRTARELFLEEEGPSGLNSVIASVSLGDFLMHRDLAQAISIFESSVDAYAAMVDGGHPYGASALHSLARARRLQHDEKGAETDFRKAIAITRAEFGSTSADLQDQLCELGDLLFAQGRGEDALVLLEEGLKIAEHNHEPAISCRRTYAGVLGQVGRRTDAHELLVSLLRELEAHPESDEVEAVRKMLASVDADSGL